MDINAHIRSLLRSIKTSMKEIVVNEERKVAYPPIPRNVMYSITARYVPDRAYVPYVCAQVGRLGRGAIGADLEGNIIMYLKPTREDVAKFPGLTSVDEIWVVM